MYVDVSAKPKAIVMADEFGYTSTAIHYKHPTARYSILKEGHFIEQTTTNSITNASSFSFNLRPSNNYLDLQESRLEVGLKVFKANGDALGAAENVCLADNVIGSLFSAVTLTMNKTRITTSNVYQTFENYFVTRFGVSKAAAKLHLERKQGLTTEKAGEHDTTTGAGWTKRKAWTALSQEVLFSGPIPCDFFRSCSQYLPPMQDVVLDFKLNDPELVLQAPANDYIYKLTSVKLLTRYVEVASAATVGVWKYQLTKPLYLNFTSMEVQSFSLPAKTHSEFIRSVFPYKKPTQIFMVLIETDRLNGVLTKNPFKFEHGNVEKVVLRQDGQPCMVDAIETDFSEPCGALRCYDFVTDAFNVGFNSRDCNLTYEQFVNGSTIWAWTLSPDMDGNNGVGVVQSAPNFDVEIQIKSTVDNPGLTALFLGKFGKSVAIAAGNETTVL
jgi:hypothetical protein